MNYPTLHASRRPCRDSPTGKAGGWPVLIPGLVRLLLFGLVAVPSPGLAQTRALNLGQMSIEDLMSIEITSASRKEQRSADAAAAVFVITQDDIRRSGMTTIPDLLRLAPGVEVAQINSNKWAVSVRGFNGLYANKLLVLVDGRSIYNRIFSGVFWDAEDLMLDDIDRIEVIRGPGAAMWGANAVNGVINIVTKATADTQGGLVRADAGRSGEQGAVRYGGTLGTATYRAVFAVDRAGSIAHRTGHECQRRVAQRHDGIPRRLDDAAWRVYGGGRLQGGPGARAVAEPQPADGRARTARDRPLRFAGRPSPWPLDAHARRRRVAADTVVRRHRRPGRSPWGTTTGTPSSVDTQYHTALGTHHDVVAGAGYRFSREQFAGAVGFSLTPAESTASLLTAFIQDEIASSETAWRSRSAARCSTTPTSGAGVQPNRARDVEGASPPAPLGGRVTRPADAVAL